MYHFFGPVSPLFWHVWYHTGSQVLQELQWFSPHSAVYLKFLEIAILMVLSSMTVKLKMGSENMKTLISSVVALFAFAAVASACNVMTSGGKAVRSAMGSCVLTSNGTNNLAECDGMMATGPGKG